MKLIKTLLTISILTILLFSCKTKTETGNDEKVFLKPEYAKGFLIKEDKTNYYVYILNPADTNELIAKIQLDKSEIKKDNSIVCFSTTHIAFCDKINHINNICGIPDTSYYSNVDIFKKLDNAEIITLANSPKYEKIIALAPDFVTTSEYQKSNFLSLENAGIKCIPILEYLETHPLGRSEWIKFFAFLLDEVELADKICKDIFKKYNDLADKQEIVKEENMIFDCTEYHGYWYAAGGKSYIATFYRDAGYDYIFADDTHNGSFPISPEIAIAKGYSTEFWRIVFPSKTEVTIDDVIRQNHLYKIFSSVKNGKVILCNPTISQYYIEDLMEPHIVLEDFINCRKGDDTRNKYYFLIKNYY